MKFLPLAAMVGFLGMTSGIRAESLVVTTSEGVGAFTSTLEGTEVFTFDELSRGVHTNLGWENVGTISKVSVIPPNVYGGAPSTTSPAGTNYAVQSSSSGLGGVRATTLSFYEPMSYFGLYWSAGDYTNVLTFYNGSRQVASFSTGSLMNHLPDSYWGNPITTGSNAGKNLSEPYGFINFYGGEDTEWTSVVLTNSSKSGFESDNWTVRAEAYNPAIDGEIGGTPVVSVQTVDGVQTTSVIETITFDGTSVIVTHEDGSALEFYNLAESTSVVGTSPDPNGLQNTGTGGGDESSPSLQAWNLHGMATGIHNPEPSVVLGFLVVGVFVVVGRRIRST